MRACSVGCSSQVDRQTKRLRLVVKDGCGQSSRAEGKVNRESAGPGGDENGNRRPNRQQRVQEQEQRREEEDLALEVAHWHNVEVVDEKDKRVDLKVSFKSPNPTTRSTNKDTGRACRACESRHTQAVRRQNDFDYREFAPLSRLPPGGSVSLAAPISWFRLTRALVQIARAKTPSTKVMKKMTWCMTRDMVCLLGAASWLV